MPNFFHAAMSRTIPAALLLACLQGCATLTEPATQTIYVQAVEGHRPVGNVGCLVSNDAGRWYVNAPGRVTVARRAQPLSVDCSKAGVAAGQEVVVSHAGAGALWGNLVVSAGVGYLVDRHSGAGHDYPDTITVLLAPAQPVVEEGLDVAVSPGTPIF